MSAERWETSLAAWEALGNPFLAFQGAREASDDVSDKTDDSEKEWHVRGQAEKEDAEKEEVEGEESEKYDAAHEKEVVGEQAENYDETHRGAVEEEEEAVRSAGEVSGLILGAINQAFRVGGVYTRLLPATDFVNAEVEEQMQVEQLGEEEDEKHDASQVHDAMLEEHEGQEQQLDDEVCPTRQWSQAELDAWYNHPMNLEAESQVAKAHNIKMQHRGPPLGPGEGGPTTWRGQPYRPGTKKWAKRGGRTLAFWSTVYSGKGYSQGTSSSAQWVEHDKGGQVKGSGKSK